MPLGELDAEIEPGVPLWLTGDALKLWACDENENPNKGRVDWEKYRETSSPMKNHS
jgi:hypothetical protein